MVIQKVFGLNATSISMNDRFTMLTSADRVLARPVKRQLTGNFLANHFNYTNRNLIEQIARRLEQQVERLALRQRLGFRQGSLRRFSSENSLPGLRRSNSFGNLSQRSVRDTSWQQNGSLKRSASFGSLFGGSWQERPKRRYYRHSGQRALRGRFGARGRGGRQNNNRQKGQMNNIRGTNKQNPGRGRRGKRGGISKNENQTPIPTKEELDAQLDEYMASSKLALDKELDTYMKNAMELE